MGHNISVVVPAYNVSQHIDTTLGAIRAALAVVGGELVVVDNGSTDGTRELLLARWSDSAKVAHLPAKTISAVRNLGARIASGEVLVFIDADCLMAPDFLRRAMQVLEQTGADAVSFHDVPPQPAEWIEQTWYRLHVPPRSGFVSTLFGGNCIIRRQAFNRAGGFNESLATGEDSELGKRLAAGGSRIYLASELTVVHLGNPKTLSDFFRRQVWHGVGMWSSWRTGGGVITPIVTLLHLSAIAVGLLILILAPASIESRLAAALLLVIAMPAAAVTYRYLQRRSVWRPARSLLLYTLYLTARVWSLFRLPFVRRYPGEMPRKLWWRR